MSYSKKRKAASQYGRVATESEVAYASPHRLVQMLMEGALDKVATAKGLIERKDYAGKSHQITWAQSIVNGLRCSLDPQAGGEIANNLNDLYAYIDRRLVEANISNDVAVLDEISGLLLEIKSAWDAMPEEIRNPAGQSSTLNEPVMG